MRVDSTGIKEFLQINTGHLQESAQESSDFHVLFHVSDNRANVVSWIPDFSSKEKKAVEIGAQLGVISSVMADKYKEYDLYDISEEMKESALIRNNKFNYVVDAFETFCENHQGQYDDVYIVGALADAAEYVGNSTTAYEDFLTACKKLLNSSGRLILACENRLGLKYWSGCQEDNNGGYYRGIENFPEGQEKRTFSKKELSHLLDKVGFKDLNWYYPYPDLYFTNSIYSDSCLPNQGELFSNINNIDKDRFLFFDEGKVFNSLISEGLFQEFANSFLIIAGNNNSLVYSKFSKERAKDFAIRTDIYKENDKYWVTKSAVYPEGIRHINNINKSFGVLSKKYDKSDLLINKCYLEESCLHIEYVEGDNLQKLIENYIQSNQEEKAEELFYKYIEKCFLNLEVEPFENTSEFGEIFGDKCGKDACELELDAVNGADIDLICSNIIVNDDGWNVIDYEWTFGFFIPRDFLIYRSIFLACHQIKACDFLNMEKLMEKYNISEAQQELYSLMESNFQNYIRGSVKSNFEIQKAVGKKVTTITDFEKLVMDNEYLQGQIINLNNQIDYLQNGKNIFKRILNKIRRK